jgi:RecJ-like exonuclease
MITSLATACQAVCQAVLTRAAAADSLTTMRFERENRIPPTTKCPRCHGTGQRADGSICDLCDGTGEIPVHEEPPA